MTQRHDFRGTADGCTGRAAAVRKVLALLLLWAAVLTVQAQVENTPDSVGGFDFGRRQAEAQAEAERAQKAAQEAAEKAAAARKEAKEAAGTRTTLVPEELQRIAQEQERQKQEAKERRERKMKRSFASTEDSLRWVADQERLRSWTRNWALGGQLAVNWLVADNVTDHPPFKHLGDALHLGVNVYGVRFFNKLTALRLGLGYHEMANRVDHETVDEAWHHNWAREGEDPYIIYNGNGYYTFGVFDLYADALFDVSGLKESQRFHPFHVYATAGLGLLAAGKKSLKGTMHEDMFERVVDEETGRTRLRLPSGDMAESFESRVKTDASAVLAIRFGLLFDYRISRQFSANMELNVNVTTGDGLEGIKYAEPFDIPIRIAAGVMYHF